MHRRGGFTGIELVVIVMILGLVGAGLYVWGVQNPYFRGIQTPTPTGVMQSVSPTPINGWDTYVNADIGISFQYPGRFVECPECNAGTPNLVMVFRDPTTVLENTDKTPDGVWLYLETVDGSFEEYITKEKERHIEQTRFLTGQDPNGYEEVITVDGEEAVFLVDYSWAQIDHLYIPVPETNQVIVLYKHEETEGSFPEFDQMVETIDLTL